MGYRANVQVKHEIKYGEDFFNWCNEALYNWLTGPADVEVYTNNEWGCGDEWEIYKDSLHKIPESAYSSENVADLVSQSGLDDEAGIVEELHAFVDALVAAPTGDIAYVSWF